MGKTFVKVTAEHNAQGKTVPLSITWTDGRLYAIDRVKDVRLAPSLKGGGVGRRYTCRICGKEVYLFEDEGKWFVES